MTQMAAEGGEIRRNLKVDLTSTKIIKERSVLNFRPCAQEEQFGGSGRRWRHLGNTADAVQMPWPAVDF